MFMPPNFKYSKHIFKNSWLKQVLWRLHIRWQSYSHFFTDQLNANVLKTYHFWVHVPPFNMSSLIPLTKLVLYLGVANWTNNKLIYVDACVFKVLKEVNVHTPTRGTKRKEKKSTVKWQNKTDWGAKCTSVLRVLFVHLLLGKP